MTFNKVDYLKRVKEGFQNYFEELKDEIDENGMAIYCIETYDSIIDYGFKDYLTFENDEEMEDFYDDFHNNRLNYIEENLKTDIDIIFKDFEDKLTKITGGYYTGFYPWEGRFENLLPGQKAWIKN